MAWGKITFLHFQAAQPVLLLDMGKWSPWKSDYNPSNKTVTLSVQGCILILCFLHLISCVKPKEIFFFPFWMSGGSKTEILIKVLGESRKGEQSPVAIRRLSFLSLCRSKVISGPESCPLSMACSRNHAPIFWNIGAGVWLQFWKDPSNHLVNGYLELCKKIEERTVQSTGMVQQHPILVQRPLQMFQGLSDHKQLNLGPWSCWDLYFLHSCGICGASQGPGNFAVVPGEWFVLEALCSPKHLFLYLHCDAACDTLHCTWMSYTRELLLIFFRGWEQSGLNQSIWLWTSLELAFRQVLSDQRQKHTRVQVLGLNNWFRLK